MIVGFTREAERDLERIADSIAADNPARAVSFIRDLRAYCLSLAEFPERYPLIERYATHGVRHRVHGNYLIFYRVDADGVTVLHVLHGAMDYAAILFPGDG